MPTGQTEQAEQAGQEQKQYRQQFEDAVQRIAKFHGVPSAGEDAHGAAGSSVVKPHVVTDVATASVPELLSDYAVLTENMGILTENFRRLDEAEKRKVAANANKEVMKGKCLPAKEVKEYYFPIEQAVLEKLLKELQSVDLDEETRKAINARLAQMDEVVTLATATDDSKYKLDSVRREDYYKVRGAEFELGALDKLLHASPSRLDPSTQARIQARKTQLLNTPLVLAAAAHAAADQLLPETKTEAVVTSLVSPLATEAEKAQADEKAEVNKVEVEQLQSLINDVDSFRTKLENEIDLIDKKALEQFLTIVKVAATSVNNISMDSLAEVTELYSELLPQLNDYREGDGGDKAKKDFSNLYKNLIIVAKKNEDEKLKMSPSETTVSEASAKEPMPSQASSDVAPASPVPSLAAAAVQREPALLTMRLFFGDLFRYVSPEEKADKLLLERANKLSIGLTPESLTRNVAEFVTKMDSDIFSLRCDIQKRLNDSRVVLPQELTQSLETLETLRHDIKDSVLKQFKKLLLDLSRTFDVTKKDALSDIHKAVLDALAAVNEPLPKYLFSQYNDLLDKLVAIEGVVETNAQVLALHENRNLRDAAARKIYNDKRSDLINNSPKSSESSRVLGFMRSDKVFAQEIERQRAQLEEAKEKIDIYQLQHELLKMINDPNNQMQTAEDLYVANEYTKMINRHEHTQPINEWLRQLDQQSVDAISRAIYNQIKDVRQVLYDMKESSRCLYKDYKPKTEDSLLYQEYLLYKKWSEKYTPFLTKLGLKDNKNRLIAGKIQEELNELALLPGIFYYTPPKESAPTDFMSQASRPPTQEVVCSRGQQPRRTAIIAPDLLTTTTSPLSKASAKKRLLKTKINKKPLAADDVQLASLNAAGAGSSPHESHSDDNISPEAVGALSVAQAAEGDENAVVLLSGSSVQQKSSEESSSPIVTWDQCKAVDGGLPAEWSPAFADMDASFLCGHDALMDALNTAVKSRETDLNSRKRELFALSKSIFLFSPVLPAKEEIAQFKQAAEDYVQLYEKLHGIAKEMIKLQHVVTDYQKTFNEKLCEMKTPALVTKIAGFEESYNTCKSLQEQCERVIDIRTTEKQYLEGFNAQASACEALLNKIGEKVKDDDALIALEKQKNRYVNFVGQHANFAGSKAEEITARATLITKQFEIERAAIDIVDLLISRAENLANSENDFDEWMEVYHSLMKQYESAPISSDISSQFNCLLICKLKDKFVAQAIIRLRKQVESNKEKLAAQNDQVKISESSMSAASVKQLIDRLCENTLKLKEYGEKITEWGKMPAAPAEVPTETNVCIPETLLQSLEDYTRQVRETVGQWIQDIKEQLSKEYAKEDIVDTQELESLYQKYRAAVAEYSKLLNSNSSLSSITDQDQESFSYEQAIQLRKQRALNAADWLKGFANYNVKQAEAVIEEYQATFEKARVDCQKSAENTVGIVEEDVSEYAQKIVLPKLRQVKTAIEGNLTNELNESLTGLKSAAVAGSTGKLSGYVEKAIKDCVTASQAMVQQKQLWSPQNRTHLFDLMSRACDTFLAQNTVPSEIDRIKTAMKTGRIITEIPGEIDCLATMPKSQLLQSSIQKPNEGWEAFQERQAKEVFEKEITTQALDDKGWAAFQMATRKNITGKKGDVQLTELTSLQKKQYDDLLDTERQNRAAKKNQIKETIKAAQQTQNPVERLAKYRVEVRKKEIEAKKAAWTVALGKSRVEEGNSQQAWSEFDTMTLSPVYKEALQIIVTEYINFTNGEIKALKDKLVNQPIESPSRAKRSEQPKLPLSQEKVLELLVLTQQAKEQVATLTASLSTIQQSLQTNFPAIGDFAKRMNGQNDLLNKVQTSVKTLEARAQESQAIWNTQQQAIEMNKYGPKLDYAEAEVEAARLASLAATVDKDSASASNLKEMESSTLSQAALEDESGLPVAVAPHSPSPSRHSDVFIPVEGRSETPGAVSVDFEGGSLNTPASDTKVSSSDDELLDGLESAMLASAAAAASPPPPPLHSSDLQKEVLAEFDPLANRSDESTIDSKDQLQAASDGEVLTYDELHASSSDNEFNHSADLSFVGSEKEPAPVEVASNTAELLNAQSLPAREDSAIGLGTTPAPVSMDMDQGVATPTRGNPVASSLFELEKKRNQLDLIIAKASEKAKDLKDSKKQVEKGDTTARAWRARVYNATVDFNDASLKVLQLKLERAQVLDQIDVISKVPDRGYVAKMNEKLEKLIGLQVEVTRNATSSPKRLKEANKDHLIKLKALKKSGKAQSAATPSSSLPASTSKNNTPQRKKRNITSSVPLFLPAEMASSPLANQASSLLNAAKQNDQFFAAPAAHAAASVPLYHASEKEMASPRTPSPTSSFTVPAVASPVKSGSPVLIGAAAPSSAWRVPSILFREMLERARRERLQEAREEFSSSPAKKLEESVVLDNVFSAVNTERPADPEVVSNTLPVEANSAANHSFIERFVEAVTGTATCRFVRTVYETAYGQPKEGLDWKIQLAVAIPPIFVAVAVIATVAGLICDGIALVVGLFAAKANKSPKQLLLPSPKQDDAPSEVVRSLDQQDHPQTAPGATTASLSSPYRGGLTR